ncbi:hypothetical protein D3C86_1837610 [compost metagenome]
MREGLGDEVVGAHLQAEQFVDLFILGGEKDNRQIRLLAKTPQKLHAVHAWHLYIENGELRRTGDQPVKRGSAVRIRFDPVAFGFERDRYGSQNIPVVVDKRDRLHVVGLHRHFLVTPDIHPAKVVRREPLS